MISILNERTKRNVLRSCGRAVVQSFRNQLTTHFSKLGVVYKGSNSCALCPVPCALCLYLLNPIRLRCLNSVSSCFVCSNSLRFSKNNIGGAKLVPPICKFFLKIGGRKLRPPIYF